MPRGGRRPGSGRKRGGANKLTHAARAEVEKVMQAPDGVTPMVVMAGTMRALWAKAQRKDGRVDPAKAMKAHAVAKDVAPYVHPRLQSIEGVPDKPLVITDGMTELERARRVAFTLVRGARASAAGEAPPPKPAPAKSSKPQAKKARAHA